MDEIIYKMWILASLFFRELSKKEPVEFIVKGKQTYFAYRVEYEWNVEAFMENKEGGLDC